LIPSKERGFSLLHSVEMDSGANAVSCQIGAVVSLPVIRNNGREDNHSPACSTETKNAWFNASITQHVFHDVVLS
jgi:hypothetical protein